MTSLLVPARGPRRSTTSMGPKAGASKRPPVPFLVETPACAGVTE